MVKIGVYFESYRKIKRGITFLNHPVRSAILISVNSAISVLTLILKQPVPSLPLLSTPNLTTVTLSTS